MQQVAVPASSCSTDIKPTLSSILDTWGTPSSSLDPYEPVEASLAFLAKTPWCVWPSLKDVLAIIGENPDEPTTADAAPAETKTFCLTIPPHKSAVLSPCEDASGDASASASPPSS